MSLAEGSLRLGSGRVDIRQCLSARLAEDS